MQKAFILTVLSWLIVQISYGQIKLGVKAGVNTSTIKIDQSSNNPENRIGYQLGLFAERSLSQKLLLRTELYYSLKGYKYFDRVSQKNVTVSHNYITLPLLAVYGVTNNFKVYLGPELNLLGPVYAKSEHRRSSDLQNVINYNNLDFGLMAGLLYTLSPRISTDLRYTYGFNTIMAVDISDSQGKYLYTIKQRNNKVWQLGINYYLKK